MADYLEPDLHRDRTARRTRLRWAAAGGVGALIATGLLTAGPDPDQPAPTPDLAAAAGAATPSNDPLVTAHRWLHSTRTVAHTDTHALAWTHRVAPLLTGPASADNDLAVHGKDTGGGWTHLVTGRCYVTVSSIDAVVPPEAPRTSDRVAVQVTGTVHTRCTDPASAAVPVEHTAATLTLTRTTHDGLWRVHERLY